MSKMRKLLAAVLVASMLLGSNGITYAAEAAGADDTVSAVEVAEEAAEKESNQAADAELPDEREEAVAPDASSEKSGDEEAPAEEIAADTSEDEDASAEESADEASADESTDDASAEESVDEASEDERIDDASAEESDEAASTEETSEAAPAEEESEAAPAEATEEAAAQATTQETAQEVFAAGELVYHGSGYDVTMAYDEKAEIPADAQLKVREIKKGTDEYDAYLSGAQAASDKGVAEARFFDITIWAKGKEIQPKSAVRVNISYKKAIDVAEEGEVKAMHFEDGTEDPDILDTDTNGGSKVDEIAFDAESFSVYGVIYTVDFTYDGYTFSMPGEGSILLSELAEKLGLYEKDLDKAFSVDNVSDVTFTDYDLIKIEKQADGDWLLTSLASFTSEETLTIAMVDGTKFVVVVTDPPEETRSGEIDITSTLESVKIIVDGQEVDADGQIDLVADTVYEIRLAFRETDDCQFSNNDTEMYYDLPDNVNFVQTSGTFTMNLGSLGELTDNTYTIRDGRVYVKFNTDDAAHMDILRMASEAHFSFKIQGSFNLKEHIINWNDSIETEVTVEEKHDAKVKKTGSYNEAENRIEYLVTVDSEGTTSGITITDTLTGTALVSNVNSVNDISVTLKKADGSTSEVTPTGFNKNGNTFVLNLPDMKDGDHYDIRYTASVDYDKLSRSGNASYSESVNGVELSWKESDEPDTDESYGYDIDYGSFSKEATDVSDVIEDATGKYRLVTYTIKSNEKMKKAVSQITDTIRTDSQSIMKMYGDGITVVVTKPDGTTETRPLAWGEGGLTKTSDYSWVYTPPTEDGAAMYEITYQTRVDMSGVNTTVNVNNDAHDDNDSDGNSQGITPGDGDQIKLSKTVASENEEEVKWSIDLTVPKSGLDTAEVTDYVPSMNTYNLYDIVKSVEVTGTNPEESYTISYKFVTLQSIDANEYRHYGGAYVAESPRSEGDIATEVYITFFKDTAKTQTGLNGGPSDRLVNIKVITENNKDWMEYARKSDGWITQQGHTNTAKIGNITASATAHPSTKNIAKYADSNNPYKVTVGGVEYPAYKYWVRLDGVNSDTNEIVDTFDKEVFELLKVNTPDDNGKIYFSDYLWNQQSTENTYAQLTDTSSGGLIRTTSLPKKSDGSYYKYYKIEYYLVMKDLNKALEKAEAAGGTVKFKNTAGYENATSEVEIEFGNPIVDKNAAIDGDKATFTITLNPDKLKLNKGADMIMRDTFSKTLSIDYSSISITTDPEENKSKVTYDYYGNTGEFKIPDETKVVITYVSKVIGTGNINIWNNAVLNGKYDDGFDEWVQISSEGEGGADIYAIYLLKYQSENMQEGNLAGAKFRVLDSELNPIKYSSKLDPESGNSGKIGQDIIFTTRADGMIMIGLSRYAHGVNLKKDTVYYLEEIEAPENMQLDATLYSFVISDDPNHANYTREDGVWVYYVGDILKIRNYPEDQNLMLTKRFAGNIALTEEQKKKISFEIVKVDENGAEITGDEAFTLTVNYEDMSNGKYIVTSETEDDEGRTTFGNGYYKVTEKNASAAKLGLENNVVAETVYSVSSNGTTKTDEAVATKDAVTGQNLANVSGSASTSVIFTNTYTTGAYYFNKVDAGTDQPLSGAVFTVKKADDDSEVTHYTTGTDGKFSIKRAGDDFSTLDENVLYYVVETTAPKNYIIPNPAPKYYFYFGTEGAEAPEGAAENNAINLGERSATETVVNASETAITVFKDWKNSDGSSISDSELQDQDLKAIITLKRKAVKDGEESEDTAFAENATLNYRNDFTKVWNDLPKTDKEGAVYKYYVVEQPISDFSVTYENNDGIESGTITVVNTKTEEKGGIKVVKTAQLNGVKDPGAAGQTFTVALFSDESGTNQVGDSKTITIGDAGTGEVTFDGLDVGTTYYVYEMDGESHAGAKIGEYTVVTGSGSAAATVAISNKVQLVNNRKTGDLKVSKTLSGNAADPADTFHFTVEVARANGSYAAEGAATSVSFTNGKAEVTLKGGESVTIKGLPDGAAYTVTETEANQDDYTTTPSTGKVTGTISADATGEATPHAAFTNTRNKGGLTVTKTFAGNTGKLKDEDKAKISFTVTGPEWEEAQTFTYAEMVNPEGVKTFENIKLGKYTVTENTGDGKTYTTTYKVGSNGTETAGTTAEAEVGTDGITVAFTNTYKETEATFDAEKFIDKAEGVTAPERKFSFTLSAGAVLTPGETAVPMPTDVEASVTGAGKVSAGTDKFGTVTYTKAGKYTYTITETDESGAGWTYDTGAVTATVTVSEDQTTGALSASVEYDKPNTAGNAAKITNKYEKGGIKVVKTAQLNGETDPGAAGQTFTVAVFSDASGTNQVGDSKTITIGRDGKGEVTFDGLDVGTTYYVFEMDGESHAGAKIGEYTVVTGSGSAEATVAIINSVQLVNNRKTGDLKVSKTLVSDRTDDADKQFHFTVEVAGATGSYAAEGLEGVESVSFTNGSATVTLKGGQSVTIKGLPDGAEYSVSEAVADQTGFTVQSKNASGTISADKTGNAATDAAFTNTRKTGDLEVKKTISSDNPIDQNKEFDFTVTLGDTGINGKYGDMTFKDGVAKFKLKHNETKTAEGLPTEITYTVTEGEVPSGYTNTGKTGNTGAISEEKQKAEFVNTYKASGSVILEAYKELNAYEGKTLKPEQFSFELYQGGELKQTKKNDAGGKVTFDSITYDKAGDYTYTIKEVLETKDGYKYDTKERSVLVKVVDNLDGTLTCTPNYGKDGNTFKNTYEAEGSVVLKAHKTLENRKLDDKQFIFELYNENGVKIQTVYNDSNGNVTFRSIGYKKPGTYKYTIKELVQNKKGYTFDTSVKNVVVTVTDLDKGILAVEVRYDGSSKIPEFINKYDASVKVSKTDVANGKELEGAKIQILDDKGKVVAEWTSGKQPHVVKGLKTGVKYTLHEVVAPNGYEITADTTFTIDKYGNVTSSGTITKDGVLLIEDAKKEEHHKKPKKKDSTNTGDEAPLGVLFGGLGIGAVGLAVLLEERRRRSKKS